MKRLLLVLLFIFAPQATHAATLNVGQSQPYKTLSAAIKASVSGDTILIDAGTYTDDFAVTRHPLTILGQGKGARLLASQLIPNGKAILVAKADLTVQNLTFENAKVADRNGAGIRHQHGALIVEDCIFRENETGILGGADPEGSVIIRNSQFLRNGYGDGYTHGIYIGKTGSLIVDSAYFFETRAGHHIKSRALSNRITNTLLDDGQAGSSYAIDLPHGGTNQIVNNKMIQAAVAHNKTILSVGTKPMHEGSTLSITGNTFINYAAAGTAIRNGLATPAIISDNTFIGALAISDGPSELSGNIVLSRLPEDGNIYKQWQDTLDK